MDVSFVYATQDVGIKSCFESIVARSLGSMHLLNITMSVHRVAGESTPEGLMMGWKYAANAKTPSRYMLAGYRADRSKALP